MDIDSVGEAATAGLIGAAVDKPAGKAGDNSGRCVDCGAEVTGRFCANCGQPAHVHRSLRHLGEELLHGVLHFDGRIWRTLPLLVFNPGRLTREWIHGKRARYVSPLAMFLFTVFVTFFALSFVRGPETTFRPIPAVAAKEGAVEFAEGRRQIAEARAAANDAKDKAALDVADSVLAGVSGQAERSAAPRQDGLKPGSWQANMHDVAAGIHASPSTDPVVRKMAGKLMNPDLAAYKVQQTFYKFAFLLVPLSIPFMALLFLWRRNVTLYDHGVFVLYSLTFVTLIGVTAIGLGMIHPALGALGWAAVTFGTPVHQFAQLKGGYSLGWFSTLWRFVFLQMFCLVIATLFIAAVLWLAVGV